MDPPSAFLPPIAHLQLHQSESKSLSTIDGIFTRLRDIYGPQHHQVQHKQIQDNNVHDRHDHGHGHALHDPHTLKPGDLSAGLQSHTQNHDVNKSHFRHVLKQEVVPDSGYASANDSEDEDEEDQDNEIDEEEGSASAGSDVDDAKALLRTDPFERAFTTRWLTSLISHMDDIDEARSEEVASLLSLCAKNNEEEEQEEEALTRKFEFELRVAEPVSPCKLEGYGVKEEFEEEELVDCGEEEEAQKESLIPFTVELNDAPVSNTDHTSVGLQFWASSIVLARMMAGDPGAFGLCGNPLTTNLESRLNMGQAWMRKTRRKTRILELGAGTGLLSITAAKIHDLLQLDNSSVKRDSERMEMDIVATDYHPDVLDNLLANVETNFPGFSTSSWEGRIGTSNMKTSVPVQVFPLDWERPPNVARFGLDIRLGGDAEEGFDDDRLEHAYEYEDIEDDDVQEVDEPEDEDEFEAIAEDDEDEDNDHAEDDDDERESRSGSGSPSKSPFTHPFDTILAADVIYDVKHAGWIRGVVSRLLRRRGGGGGLGRGQGEKEEEKEVGENEDDEGDEADEEEDGDGGGTFWLIIPLGRTGRHEGVGDTVLEAFPLLSPSQPEAASARASDSSIFQSSSTATGSISTGTRAFREIHYQPEWQLRTVSVRSIPRSEGVGRADEGGYRLFEIRWCPVRVAEIELLL